VIVACLPNQNNMASQHCIDLTANRSAGWMLDKFSLDSSYSLLVYLLSLPISIAHM